MSAIVGRDMTLVGDFCYTVLSEAMSYGKYGAVTAAVVIDPVVGVFKSIVSNGELVDKLDAFCGEHAPQYRNIITVLKSENFKNMPSMLNFGSGLSGFQIGFVLGLANGTVKYVVLGAVNRVDLAIRNVFNGIFWLFSSHEKPVVPEPIPVKSLDEVVIPEGYTKENKYI